MVAVKDSQQPESPANAGTTESSLTIALAGNPNVGKSVIFNALTGMNADVSNYPGTTIDVSRGKLAGHDLVDTPGVYGVSSLNDEERIARSMLIDCDRIVNVVSALSLDRDLFLTLQLLDMGKSMVLVINQIDEAESVGLSIDVAQLALTLDIPVLTTVAITGKNVAQIPALVHQARVGAAHPEVVQLLDELLEQGVGQERALLLMEGDATSMTEAKRETFEHKRADIYRLRRQRVNELFESSVSQSSRKRQFSTRLGRMLLDPFAGSVVAAIVSYLLFYQLLGVIVAGNVVDFTEKKTMKAYYEPFVRRTCAVFSPVTITADGTIFDFPSGTLSDQPKTVALDQALAKTPPGDVSYNFWSHPGFPAIVGNVLVGQYGILTLTVTYLLGLLLPLVLAFYLGLSLMEDSGYLPRLAVLVDRLLNKLGLTGRAIIPLILGLGCVTMATVTTRLLSSTREKIIATALLGVAIPCSAQLGIVSGVLAKAGGLAPWLIYGVIVAGILVGTGLALNTVLPGKSGALMIDLPPMRLPRADNVLKKTFSKSWNFMIESIPMFALAGLVVSIGEMTGLLSLFVDALRPLTVELLKLPADPRIATTFILGIVRRDFAAFGLTDVALTPAQAVVSMVVITLFVPCIATVGVMIKERGAPVALTIWLGSWLAAFAIGGVLAQVLPIILPALKF